MKYRGRLEIITAILRTIVETHGDGAAKTRIMYGAYLSYGQLVEYIKFLEVRGIIVTSPDYDGRYQLTQKGMDFFKLCVQVEEYEKPDEPKTLPAKKESEIA